MLRWTVKEAALVLCLLYLLGRLLAGDVQAPASPLDTAQVSYQGTGSLSVQSNELKYERCSVIATQTMIRTFDADLARFMFDVCLTESNLYI